MNKEFNALNTQESIDFVNTCTDAQLAEYKVYFERQKRMVRRPLDSLLPASLQLIQDAIDKRS
jgi:phosphoenolpyruvate-protein kinase (PTS system EI component)